MSDNSMSRIKRLQSAFMRVGFLDYLSSDEYECFLLDHDMDELWRNVRILVMRRNRITSNVENKFIFKLALPIFLGSLCTLSNKEEIFTELLLDIRKWSEEEIDFSQIIDRLRDLSIDVLIPSPQKNRTKQKASKPKTFKIFVSGVTREFKEVREEIKKEVENEFQLIDVFVSEEEQSPSSSSPLEKIKEEIESCDMFIILLGEEFGSIYPGKPYSITEWEFDIAKDNDIPRLVYYKEHIQPSKAQEKFIEKTKNFIDGSYTPQPIEKISDLKKNIIETLSMEIFGAAKKGFKSNRRKKARIETKLVKSTSIVNERTHIRFRVRSTMINQDNESHIIEGISIVYEDVEYPIKQYSNTPENPKLSINTSPIHLSKGEKMSVLLTVKIPIDKETDTSKIISDIKSINPGAPHKFRTILDYD